MRWARVDGTSWWARMAWTSPSRDGPTRRRGPPLGAHRARTVGHPCRLSHPRCRATRRHRKWAASSAPLPAGHRHHKRPPPVSCAAVARWCAAERLVQRPDSETHWAFLSSRCRLCHTALRPSGLWRGGLASAAGHCPPPFRQVRPPRGPAREVRRPLMAQPGGPGPRHTRVLTVDPSGGTHGRPSGARPGAPASITLHADYNHYLGLGRANA